MSGERVCLIGLGEVGRILGEDLAQAQVGLSGYDSKFGDKANKPATYAAQIGVWAAASAQEAAAGCDIIISAVTTAQTLTAAHLITAGLGPNAVFLDLNSASSGVKRQAADAIHGAGGRYVEAAVMSSFPPKRLAKPILLGGPHAEAFLPTAAKLGFAGAKVFSTETGRASAAKMCRSVMVKGIEALLSESMLTARAYGVEDAVISSLDDLFPGPDWKKLACYMISRTLDHGTRRAEEMREAARTVREVGLVSYMSDATAERQAWAPQFADALGEEDLYGLLDAIRTMAEAKQEAAA